MMNKLADVLSRKLFLLFCILVLAGCSSDSSNNTNNGNTEHSKAEAGAIQFSSVGKSIQLDASQSTGAGISYHWTLRSAPDSSVARLSDFESAEPVVLVDKPGDYVAQLIVMDKTHVTSKDFTVINVAETPAGNSGSLTNHDGLTQRCQSCHNGTDAVGRSIVHIAATEECVVCHSVVAWSPVASIDHNEIRGTCSYCHDGVRATAKPATHIATTAECNQCHNAGTTFTFAVLRNSPLVGIASDEDDDDSSSDDDDDRSGGGGDDHPPIGNLMCVDCHNNVIEEGKDGDHILTTDLCETCHNTNDWEPAVTVDHTQVVGQCSSCHNNNIAEGKPSEHIVTTAECNVCHMTTDWEPATGGGGAFDHSTLSPTTLCTSCHDGVVAAGKTPDHIQTTADCDVCHTTNGWTPANGGVGPFDHSALDPTTLCTSCHNGATATGLTPNHIPTTAECDVCHTTMAWTPASGGSAGPFDHSTLDPGALCTSCHDGATATGLSPNHIPTTEECDVCHTTMAWSPANLGVGPFDHSTLAPTTLCTSCHNGATASGLSPNHIITVDECDVCHTTMAWLPATIGAGPFDHSTLAPTTVCMTCHDGAIATGKSSGHIQTRSDCDVCHVTNTWLILLQLP